MKSTTVLPGLFLFLLVVVRGGSFHAQCPVTAYANPSTIYCGNSVSLTAVADGCKPLNNNFNDGTINAGGTQPWASTNGATVQNGTGAHACVGPPSEGAYSLWMGTTVAAPRAITTNGYDLTACNAVSATLCFDMKYGIQANSSPCEGIDLPEEGVYIQYSINGGAWQTLQYYDPNGGSDPTLTSWTRYCLDIPLAALGTNTAFRWFQSESSGAGFDAWGLDNMVINLNVPGYTFDWTHDVQGASSSPATPNVSPTSNSTYTVTYTNGVETCNSSVSVTVISPTASASVNTTSVCAGGSVQLNAQSSIQMEPPSACGLAASLACTPFSSQADEQQVGSGTTTIAYNTGGDNVFGNFGTAVQTSQILFRAGELTAAGMVAGKITNLSFDIQRIETSGGGTLSTITYPNIVIRLACTNLTALPSSYSSVGAVQVYSGTGVNLSTGWSTLFFQSGYNWDGVSNLIVEICIFWTKVDPNFDTASQDAFADGGTSNYYPFCRYNAPGYNCFFADQTNFSGGSCQLPGSPGVRNIRPNVRFGFCRPINVVMNYSWSSNPAGFTSSVKNPTATPGQNTSYTVSVNQAGMPAGCAATANVSVSIAPAPTVTINPSPVEICASQGETFESLNALASTTESSTAPKTYSSSASSAVPDGNTSCTGTGTASNTIMVGGASPLTLASNPVQSVTINMSCSRTNDYEFYLIAPDGTSRLIVNRKGGTGTVIAATIATAAAALPVAGGISGTYGPDNSFPTTGNVNGIWTLRVVDKCKPTAITSSTGTLNSWSITFSAPDDIASYSWSPATNLSSTTSAFTTTNTSSPRTYTVTATTSTGCTGQASVNVLIGCTLPVDLSSFDAGCDGEDVLLSWNTLSQINNDYYTIERSFDGEVFEALAQVDGGGTSSSPQSYAYRDQAVSPLKGREIYYRLRQTDFDGKSELLYTQVAEHCFPAENCLAVYPNPSGSGEIFFDMGKALSELTLEIHDMYGHLVLRESLEQPAGKIAVRLPETISPGVYFISSRNEKIKFCEQKILVQ
ncbi:MAG: T9SS type A sorting domain-containing protein [Bacteroidota bacterium]